MKKNKKILKKEKSEELDLFSFSNVFENKKEKYSNTVEYDILPKFFYNEIEKNNIKKGVINIIERKFEYKNKIGVLKISPAIIKDGDITKFLLPSLREEIIEDVIRKFATDPQKNSFPIEINRLEVRFTLYELWTELRRINHAYDYKDTKEALNILSSTFLETSETSDKRGVKFPMFDFFGRDEDINDNFEKNKYFVRFNKMVSQSVQDKEWRIINYEQCMMYKKTLSRFLHKRISYLYLTKTIERPYKILLSTIIEYSGIKKYKTISENIRQVRSCLDEMKAVGSVGEYQVDTGSYKDKNKITDALFIIYMSQKFVDDIFLGDLALNGNSVKKINSAEKKQDTSFKDVSKINSPLETIKSFLKDKIDLKDNEIKKIANFVIDNNTIENNLQAGITYIEKQKTTEKKVNGVAILIMAIKENWQSNLSSEIKEYKIETPKEAISQIMLEDIKDSYKKIKEKWVEQFGVATYNAWLKRLIFTSNENDILILNIDNAFMKEIIEKDYLNGRYRKQNGIKTLLQKGMLEIVKDIIPNIKEIKIVVI